LAFAQAGIDVAFEPLSRKIEAVVSAAFETGVKAKAYPLDLAQIEQVKENQRHRRRLWPDRYPGQ